MVRQAAAALDAGAPEATMAAAMVRVCVLGVSPRSGVVFFLVRAQANTFASRSHHPYTIPPHRPNNNTHKHRHLPPFNRQRPPPQRPSASRPTSASRPRSTRSSCSAATATSATSRWSAPCATCACTRSSRVRGRGGRGEGKGEGRWLCWWVGGQGEGRGCLRWLGDWVRFARGSRLSPPSPFTMPLEKRRHQRGDAARHRPPDAARGGAVMW